MPMRRLAAVTTRRGPKRSDTLPQTRTMGRMTNSSAKTSVLLVQNDQKSCIIVQGLDDPKGSINAPRYPASLGSRNLKQLIEDKSLACV